MKRSIEFLTVGKLKEILEGISDDVYVAIVDPFGKNHIDLVTSVGYLVCEYEECDVIGLLSSDNVSIKDETEYCTKELFNSRGKIND